MGKRVSIYQWLDENYGQYGVEAVLVMLTEQFDIKRSSAKVYVSNWRKANGTARQYIRKEKVADVQTEA